MALWRALAAAVLGAGAVVPTRAGCANARWTDAYSQERCHVSGDAALVQCPGKSGAQCGMRMESTFSSGMGLHSMGIKAAPGPGVVTTFYLSNNGGLYDKSCTNPWVELDYEIMGNQVGPQSRIWTNMFTGTCQEHWQWITVPFDVSAGYHTYAFDITSDSVSWVIDGVAYRTESIADYSDVRGSAQSSSFREFVSVWGKSSSEPGEGIPQFRDALGMLDHNTNAFPLLAGFKRDVAQGGPPSPDDGPSPAPSPAPCSQRADPWDSCGESKCCAEGYTCFEKDAHYAQCRPSCTPGVHEDDLPEYRTPWSCAVLSPAPSPSPAPVTSPATPAPTPAPSADPATCSSGPGLWQSCQHSKCCADGSTCFKKNEDYAQCRPSCTPGVHDDDLPQYRDPWSCAVLSAAPSSTPAPAPSPEEDPATCSNGPGLWQSCQKSKCCADGSTCFEKDANYAQCRPSCSPGIHHEDKPEYQTPWSCRVLTFAVRRLGSQFLV